MEIIKELSKNKTVLLLIPSLDYHSVVSEVMKQLSEKDVMYIALNRTQDSLSTIFDKEGIKIKNVIFVDAVFKTINENPKLKPDVHFIDSPAELGEISQPIAWATKKELTKNVEYLVFDSLDTLLVYNDKEKVIEFFSNIVNMIEESSLKAVFFAIIASEHQAAIKEFSVLVDKVVDLSY